VRKALLVFATVALFTGANALLYTRNWSDQDGFFLFGLLVVVGLAFGSVVGRAWALTLPLTWIPLTLAFVLLDQDPGREITTLYLVVLTLLVTAPFQAGGVALGVWLRRRHTGEE
jgi:hypothetical protein